MFESLLDFIHASGCCISGADIVFQNHECVDDDVLTFLGFCILSYSARLVTMLSLDKNERQSPFIG